MSSRCDRKKAGRAWHPSRTVEMLSLIEQFREYERLLSSYPDPSGDLARLKAEFWANTSQVLDRVPVKPGQPCGTFLGKRSKMPSVALNIVDFETLGTGGWLVTAAGRVDGVLKTAMQRLGGIALSEMHNRSLDNAGEVRSVKIEGGMARLIARIGPHAGTVVKKIKHRVLPFIELIHDGAGEILSVALVDRPEASDGIMKGSRTVLAKLYRKEGETMNDIEKAAINYALQHKMTGAQPEVDQAVWSLLYKAQRPVGQISTAPVTSSLGWLTGRSVR